MSTSQHRNRLAIARASRRWVAEQLEERRLLANSYALTISGVTGELPLESMDLTTEFYNSSSLSGSVKFTTAGSIATPGLLYEAARGPQRSTVSVVGRNAFGAVFTTLTFSSASLLNMRASASASDAPGDHADELSFAFRAFEWRYFVNEDPAQQQVVGSFNIATGAETIPDFGESGATATSAPLTLRDGNGRAMSISSFDWATEFRFAEAVSFTAPLNESAVALAILAVGRPSQPQPFRLNANRTYGSNVVQYNEWTFDSPIITSASFTLASGGEGVAFGLAFPRVTQTFRTFGPNGSLLDSTTNTFNYSTNTATGSIRLPGTSSTTQYVLKLTGVTGDLPLDSFEWGAERIGNLVRFDDLEANVAHSLASPVLMQLAASGAIYTSATIECRNATGLYATLTLGDVAVSRFHVSNASGEEPGVADFRLDFASFAWQFRRGASAANQVVAGNVNAQTQTASGTNVLNDLGYSPASDVFAISNTAGTQGMAIDEFDWASERSGILLSTDGMIVSGPMRESAFALLFATATGTGYSSLRFTARRVVPAGLQTFADLAVTDATPMRQRFIFGLESIRQEAIFSPRAVEYTHTPFNTAGVAGTPTVGTINFALGTGSGSITLPTSTVSPTGLFLQIGSRRLELNDAEWSLRAGAPSASTVDDFKASAEASQASPGFLAAVAIGAPPTILIQNRNAAGLYSQFSLASPSVDRYRMTLSRDGASAFGRDFLQLGYIGLSWSYNPGENPSTPARTGSVSLSGGATTVPAATGGSDYSPANALTLDYGSNTVGLPINAASYEIERIQANSQATGRMTIDSLVSEASVALAFETARGSTIPTLSVNERSFYAGAFQVDHELKHTVASLTSFVIRLSRDDATQSFTFTSQRFDSTWTPRSASGIPGNVVTSFFNFAQATGVQSLVFPVNSATIAGTIFNDANADGLLNGGETGSSGRTVFLDSNANRLYDAGEPIAITTAGGAYTIDLVPAGSYGLGLVLTNGVLVTTLLPAPLALAQGQSRSQSLGVAARTWFPSPGAGVTYSVVVNTLGLRGGNYSFTGDPASTTPDLNVLAVNGSTLSMQGIVRIGELSLATGTSATLNGTGASTLSVKALSIGTNARLDLTRNNLVVDYATGNSPASAIRGYLAAGRAGGGWNSATGIVSTSVQSNPGTTVGYAEATAVLTPPATFAGLTIDSSSLLVRYTREGDANLDRTTNFDDLLRLAASYNATGGRVFSQGDFNYDGNVNFDDLLLLAASYNTTITAAPPPILIGSGPDDSDGQRGSADDIL